MKTLIGERLRDHRNPVAGLAHFSFTCHAFLPVRRMDLAGCIFAFLVTDVRPQQYSTRCRSQFPSEFAMFSSRGECYIAQGVSLRRAVPQG
jgi:hypothetical protein